VAEIRYVIQDYEKRFCDFQKIRTVVEYLSFPFNSDLNNKETAATVSEYYSLIKASLENEILALKVTFFSRSVLGKCLDTTLQT
jgi:hypothetical protein